MHWLPRICAQKQIEMLLKWVQEEEQNIAGSGDKDVFRVDEAQIDVSEGEEAAQEHILKRTPYAGFV